ncbi:hypothetical protein L1887_46920 [Cichorium endivia]|nr:hypothetical protein L1887_46920 [Cichorium endivia]
MGTLLSMLGEVGSGGVGAGGVGDDRGARGDGVGIRVAGLRGRGGGVGGLLVEVMACVGAGGGVGVWWQAIGVCCAGCEAVVLGVGGHGCAWIGGGAVGMTVVGGCGGGGGLGRRWVVVACRVVGGCSGGGWWCGRRHGQGWVGVHGLRIGSRWVGVWVYAVPSLIYGKGVGRSSKGGSSSSVGVGRTKGTGLRALWFCGRAAKDVLVGGGPLVERAAWSSARGGHDAEIGAGRYGARALDGQMEAGGSEALWVAASVDENAKRGSPRLRDAEAWGEPCRLQREWLDKRAVAAQRGRDMGRKGRAGRGRLAVLGATVSMVCESTTDEAMLDGGKGRRRGRMAVVMVVNTHTTHLAAAVLQRLAERSVGLDPPPTAAAAAAAAARVSLTQCAPTPPSVGVAWKMARFWPFKTDRHPRERAVVHFLAIFDRPASARGGALKARAPLQRSRGARNAEQRTVAAQPKLNSAVPAVACPRLSAALAYALPGKPDMAVAAPFPTRGSLLSLCIDASLCNEQRATRSHDEPPKPKKRGQGCGWAEKERVLTLASLEKLAQPPHAARCCPNT